MQRIVRAVPIKSKEALVAFAEGIQKWAVEDRNRFLSYFGGAVEEWYYQEINGKPHVIAVVEGNSLEDGFALYPQLQDPFFVWFHEQVLALSGVDLREVPTAAASEMVFRFSA